MKPHLSFQNWTRFQHYTDRKPPWIKLYSDFHETTAHLSTDARLVACLLFCVAANKANLIPHDPHWISVEIAVPKRNVERALEELLADGMLVPASNSASNSASKSASKPASKTASNTASKIARPSRAPARSQETEAETETETEGEVSSIRSGRANRDTLAHLEHQQELWTALTRIFGDVQSGPEHTERQEAVRHFLELGANGEEIARRALNYQSHYPGMAYTPRAVLKHWSKADKPKVAVVEPARQSRDERTRDQILDRQARWGYGTGAPPPVEHPFIAALNAASGDTP